MNKIPMLERFAAQSLVEHNGELIFSKEKFAELIVKECAKHITTANIEAIPPDDKAIKVLLDVLVEDMKDYFGVES